MLESLLNIFNTETIEVNNSGEKIQIHSHTSKEQGIFLQKIFDSIQPVHSLEIGFAYGISTMFILEKHREYNSKDSAHIVIEPDPYWGNAAIHNITKEGLDKFLVIKKGYSDEILPGLFHQNHRIQYAFIDTTKQFDVVFHDFYFINKLLDVGGVVIFDDCDFPGIKRVTRFINQLPNYKILACHYKDKSSIKKNILRKVLSLMIRILPFKNKFYPTIDFKTDEELGLDYRCIAFQKTSHEERDWNWDRPI